MCTSVLLLYHSVLIPILSEWISAEDLCCLDTAVVNSALRPKFLVIMAKCFIINCEFSMNNGDEFYEWILSRGLSLKKIGLDTTLTKLQSEVLSKNRRFTCLEIRDSVEVIRTLSALNLSVDKLVLEYSFTTLIIAEIRKAFPSLSHLDLSQCVFGETELISLLSDYPYLPRLSAPYCIVKDIKETVVTFKSYELENPSEGSR